MSAACLHHALIDTSARSDGHCPLCLLALGLHDGNGGDDDGTAVHPRVLRAADHSDEIRTPFTPGTVIAGRFRITSLLGRGGMGEVYRADDLKLGEPVALKFLPQSRRPSPDAERFVYDEVRNSRRIAHPNVCRVHDVFELEGRPFIAMEFVDGENFATLLARIGRLSYRKALEIGRDICAGLEAAHASGIVHGDLKPANILIDGHGRARITDFGLSRLSGETSPNPLVAAGTLAYMAPEQFLRNEVSNRSDVYALGLVLFEVFTGRRARQARTQEELEASFHDLPTPPSAVQPRMDAGLEQIILRCLAADPAQRPKSVREVLDAFPAGEPLEAMIAAGDTPPPEVVAASAAAIELSVGQAWGLLVTFVAALTLVVAASERLALYGRISLPKDPQVLAERAREEGRRLAAASSFADEGFWFEAVPAPAIVFHWRGSPVPMLPRGSDGILRANDPPLDVPGMVHVVLDPAGNLIDAATATRPLTRVQALDGFPAPRLPHVIYLLLLVSTLTVGVWLARRNIRAGRVDRKAALRVALWVLSSSALYGLLVAHHPLAFEKEAALLQTLLGTSVLLAVEVWLAYVALEPLVRRTAPHALITWTRLVQGRIGDTVVGRDLLAGALAGVVMRMADHLRNYAPTVFPSLHVTPSQLAVDALGSTRLPVAILFRSQAQAIFYALFALFLLSLLQRLLRSARVAGLVWFVLVTAAFSRWDDPRLDAAVVGIQMLIVLGLMTRAGLLATTTAIFAFLVTVHIPLTFDASAFYFAHSAIALAVLAAIALYGFRSALGRRAALAVLDPA